MEYTEFDYISRKMHILAFMEGYLFAKGKEGEVTVFEDTVKHFPSPLDQELLCDIIGQYEKQLEDQN